MPGGPATILGGLPVWAEVWFSRGDGWMTDDDAGVDSLHWLKRDGTKGAEVSQKVYDRVEAKDPYWECDVTQAVSEHLAYEQYERELMDVRCKPCKGTGVKHGMPPWSLSGNEQKRCPRCRGTGTFVSRTRAGLGDFVELT